MSDSRRRAKHKQEFREESVRQVLAGSSFRAVADSLGTPKASLGNWVRQHELGDLGRGPTKATAPVSAEQIEIARLTAENAQLQMERDIAKKPRRTLRWTRCKVRLDSKNERSLADSCDVQGVVCQRKRILRLAAFWRCLGRYSLA